MKTFKLCLAVTAFILLAGCAGTNNEIINNEVTTAGGNNTEGINEEGNNTETNQNQQDTSE